MSDVCQRCVIVAAMLTLCRLLVVIVVLVVVPLADPEGPGPAARPVWGDRQTWTPSAASQRPIRAQDSGECGASHYECVSVTDSPPPPRPPFSSSHSVRLSDAPPST